MTHRGPFQPLPFCDSVIYEEHVFIELFILFILINSAPVPRPRGQRTGKEASFVCLFLLIKIFHL